MVFLFLSGGEMNKLAQLKADTRASIDKTIKDNNLKNIANRTASKEDKVTHVEFLDTQTGKISEIIKKLAEDVGVQWSGTRSRIPKLNDNIPTKFPVGKTNPLHFVSFRPYSVSSGRLPTDVQEHGTSFILGQIIRSNANKGRMYKNANEIFNDKKVYEGLMENVFFNHTDKLKEWIYTYYQQQKEFLSSRENYASVRWGEFVYQGNSFVKIFDKYIANDGLYNDFEKGIKVKKYTEWNPADIYAAKDMGKIKQELDKIFNKGMPGPDGASLIELNGYLQTLLKEKRLVGISLKKIKTDKTLRGGAEAILELRNTELSKFKDPHIEDKNFTMQDIYFVIDNIHLVELVSTYINFGTSFAIDVRSSSSKFQSLDWATQIKGKAAQGGNAPRQMVVDLMKSYSKGNIQFKNEHYEYPRTVQEFSVKKSPVKYDKNDYKKWYDEVKPYFKNSKARSADGFKNFYRDISRLYQKGKGPAAQTKLMTLHFFYESLRDNKKNVKFWLRILYLGMKVGKIFAPHAKIY